MFHLNDSYLRNKRVRPVKATDKIIKNVVGVLVLGKEERGTRCCLKGVQRHGVLFRVMSHDMAWNWRDDETMNAGGAGAASGEQ